ncbi:MAG: 50S ribosomal protein L9 [Eubacteriales bacterium]|nr:50S ribosomal protein L9 [Eubacteriales bacterium]MDD3200095.1 50S ribosomal protein L9 [Eubacteriales bacterium]MDD4121807.1 50S ribosomal protein L9 [Eubacteriales bacterium]MDD4630343.1 50S ribosomal protein L9 [Eubacteriales bacterium]
MIIILEKDVKGVGKAGEVVKVSDGYARNMLLPRGLAKEATEGNVRNLEKQKAIQEEQHQNELAEAKKLAEKIGSLKVEIVTKSGEGGRLFGSITSKDIADALLEQHKINADKRKIILESPIKQTGDYQLDIKIYPEVTAKLKVTVLV